MAQPSSSGWGEEHPHGPNYRAAVLSSARSNARVRLEGTWAHQLIARLAAADVGNSVMLFGATLLLSVLPFLILLSSLADRRIDDDISRHIGLDSRGTHIVEGLFRSSPAHPAAPIATGLLIGLAGTVTVVACLQGIYERVFAQPHRGWRDLPRYLVWVAVLLAVLLAEGAAGKPIRGAGGPVLEAVVAIAALTVFFCWTMHFLLAGRLPWPELVRPAFVTALMWIGLALFSSAYFSSAVVSDTRLYGTIGVVFSLLTWFIAIGAVIVLGAVAGALWEERRQSRLS
jgi:membrane protein